MSNKYTKIPVTVEAVQWTRDTPMRELIEFTNHLVRLNDVEEEFYVYDRLHDTWIKFQYTDWIIKGVVGEFYPCADETFKTTYRPEKAKRQPVIFEPDPLRHEVGQSLYITGGGPGNLADIVRRVRMPEDRLRP